ncbi:MAG TPA: XylR family transcriptional regulator [Planctomycetota bacterium]|nr:XylR family transcriptional regulator [Planctomycetota bacterium]
MVVILESMARLPHVALLIETSRSYGREVLRGVRRYMSEQGPWSVYLETRALESEAPAWLRGWKGDGILVRTGTAALARQVRATSVPVVELRSRRFNPRAPWVGVDNRALGETVAEHLLDRGFRTFGLLALDTEDFFRERCANFVATLRRRGLPCVVLQAPPRAEHPARWEAQQRELVGWVRRLPKPAGIMACTDQLGFWLLDACARAGIPVPEEIAVVGVENDEALCLMARPPLSSVALNTERIGYEAAGMLDRLMRGRALRNPVVHVEPLGIVARQSSDVVAVEDPRLARALRHIREHACEGIGVGDVLLAASLSRSTLERGLRRLLGRSPHDELGRVRLERARRLLVETDLKLAAVAHRAGFRHVQHFCAVFKKAFGRTPGRYRRRRTSPSGGGTHDPGG